MRTARHEWTRKLGRAAGLSGALFAFMATNDDNGCTPDVPEGGNQAECSTNADCSGDPGVDCVGAWACVSGQCDFQCGTTEPTGCFSDDSCDPGYHCNAAEVCHRAPGCEDGQDCIQACYGDCVPDVEPPAGCTDSGQCPIGQFCTTELGACDNCPDGANCFAPCTGECKPRDNGGICYGDDQCPTGQFCDMDPCVFPDGARDAGADMIACGGVCASREGCNGPDDCGPGEVCGCAPWTGDANGSGGDAGAMMPCFLQCLPAQVVCAVDADCGAGWVCVNGQCQEEQRTCGSNEECPAGWACESTCGATEPAYDANGDGVPDSSERPVACPSVCVPQGGTCADTGVVCAEGEVCVNECYTVCDDCACPAGEPCDCNPNCYEECRSACVPQSGTCDPNLCPEGTHCGCPDGTAPTPYNGLYYCEEKCVPDVVTTECWSDGECLPGYYCAPSDCAAADPIPCDDPSGANCGQRPAPPMCPGTCQPAQPAYDCKDDSTCISADGTQGYCRFEVCEGFAPACGADDPNCDAMPPAPACYGFCVYETTTSCDPTRDACPAGTHCEAVSSCGGVDYNGDGVPDGGAADPAMPCYADYQCVPDQVECRTDCDCDPSLACVGGECSVVDRMNTCGMNGCTDDSQCADGQYCKIDYSQPVCACAGCPCSIPRGECVPKDDVVPCQVDSDCGADEVCGCGSDPNCPACDVCFFQCMPKPYNGYCDADADCRDGEVCTMYYPPCAPPQDEFAPPACEPIGMCEPKPQGCHVTGCSGTVCAEEDIATTCEWFDYYECYKLAICDYGADGVCGWQKTDGFVECMARYQR